MKNSLTKLPAIVYRTIPAREIAVWHPPVTVAETTAVVTMGSSTLPVLTSGTQAAPYVLHTDGSGSVAIPPGATMSVSRVIVDDKGKITGIDYIVIPASTSPAAQAKPVTTYVTSTRVIPGYYTTYTEPARIIQQSSPDLGWNASAFSLPILPYNGYVEFSVRVDSIGVIAGLNEADSATGSGYSDINHALYFNNGQVQVVENGKAKTTHFNFHSADVFKIERTNGVVAYFQNNTLLFSGGLPSLGAMVLDASLYAADDSILDASLVSLTQNNTLIGDFLPLGGGLSEGETLSGSFPPLWAELGDLEVVVVPPSGISDVFAALDGEINMVQGQAGTLFDGFSAYGGVLADVNYGLLTGGFLPLDGIIGKVLEPVTGKGYLAGFSAQASGRIEHSADNANKMAGFAAQAIGYGSSRGVLPGFAAQAKGRLANIALATGELAGFYAETTGRLVNIGQDTGATLITANTVAGFSAQASGHGGGYAVLPGFASAATGTLINISLGTAHLAGFAAKATGRLVNKPQAKGVIAGFAAQASGRVIHYVWVDGVLKPVLDAGAGWIDGADYANLQDPLAIAPAIQPYTGTDAVVMNTATQAVTRYSQFPFSHLVKIQDAWYGVKPDGLYRLDKALPDDGGTPFTARALTKDFSFDTFHSKRASKIWINADAPTQWTSIADGVAGLAYTSDFTGRKLAVGRGISARYQAWDIAQITKLEGFEIFTDKHVRQRRVH